MNENNFVVCITGASGVIYGIRLIEELSKFGKVYVIVSKNGYIVMEKEHKIKKTDFIKRFSKNRNVFIISEKNIASNLASGSFLTNFKAVIVAPCSMSTLGAIANGVNYNLIHRVSEVALKEKVKLILLVREMPYSLIHIENMRKVSLAGGIIAPASPSFYNYPESIDDMINFVIGKILDLIGIENNLYKRWNS